MKKIAFIIRIFQEKNFHGGGEKLFYNLIKRFSRDGWSVDIYCSVSDVEKTDFINEINVINEYYDHNKPETMEKFYAAVKKISENKGYKYIISENITPPVDIAFFQGHSLLNRLKKTKNFFESFLYNFRKVKKQRIKYQEKWINTGYRKIFVVSNILKQDIMENFGVSESKIKVVYPGVDILLENPEFKPLEKGRVTFGLIALGFKIKGGFIFLNALKILRKKGYKFSAKIIYPKHKKNIGVKFLLWKWKLSSFVEFFPYQEKIYDFYKSIDCLVAPSVEDTFNLAVLEAMSCGKPCIISTSAGSSEIIKQGKNGFIFDISTDGAENLARKMEYFIENTDFYYRFSSLAFETAKEYNWENTYRSFSEKI
jgi:glycosyltransferase involved in cell wall biosynthesis